MGVYELDDFFFFLSFLMVCRVIINGVNCSNSEEVEKKNESGG